MKDNQKKPAATAQQIAQARATISSAEKTLGAAANILPTNVTALNNAIIAAKKQAANSSDYTQTSWDAYTTVLGNATNLLKPGNTQTAVNKGVTDLNAALAALVAAAPVQANVDDLNSAIKADSTPANPQGTYSTTTWTAYANALSAAKAISANPAGSLNSAIKAATDTLNKAFKALAPAKNTDNDQPLTDAITAFSKAYNVTVSATDVTDVTPVANTTGVSGDYTSTSWAAVTKAALAVFNAKGQNLNSTAISAYVAQLNSAIAGLQFNNVTTTALAKDVKAAQALFASDYTQDKTWTDFQTALKAAVQALTSNQQ